MSRPRRGKTLIELAVILTISTVVLMLATATLVTLFRLQRQLSSDSLLDVTLANLFGRWRADVHRAIDAKVATDCELEMADGRTVVYTFKAPAIEREVRRAGSVEHRDAFLVSRQAQVVFASTAAGSGALLSISVRPVEQPSRAATIAPRPFTAVAALNVHGQPREQPEAAP